MIYVPYYMYFISTCIQYYRIVIINLSSSSDSWLVLGGGNVRSNVDLMDLSRGAAPLVFFLLHLLDESECDEQHLVGLRHGGVLPVAAEVVAPHLGVLHHLLVHDLVQDVVGL